MAQQTVDKHWLQRQAQEAARRVAREITENYPFIDSQVVTEVAVAAGDALGHALDLGLRENGVGIWDKAQGGPAT